MKYCFFFLIWIVIILSACDSTNQIDPVNSYRVEVVSSAEGDIPTGTPVEVVLGFKEFSAKVQQLSFDFPSGQVAVTVGGAFAAPGQRVPVVLEGTSLAKFNVTGLKAGTHKITVRAENGDASSSCVVSLTISDRVYRVELLNTPAPIVGKKEVLQLKVVDAKDPNHLFYTTPGYTITARSLDEARSSIILGVDEVWNNTASTPVVGSIPLNWASNESPALYNGLSIGTHKVEFTVTAPDGAISRTVHTLQVDSSKVKLTPRQTPKTKLSVTETHDATFDVDYCEHPTNKVSLMWERLPIGDPYGVAPDVTIDFERPKAGEWTEFKFTPAVGSTSYPFPPAKAGPKQGFRLHVKDMYGWTESFDYRFDVTSSDFTVSIVASNTPYVQNLLNSVKLRIENYPLDMKFRYKLVRSPGLLPTGCAAVALFDKKYSDDNETWYAVDLSGTGGKPSEQPIAIGYGAVNGMSQGGLAVVVEDRYGVQHTATFVREFVENDLIIVSPSERKHNMVFGGSVKWTCTLKTAQSDQHTFSNVRLEAIGLDPSMGVLEANGVRFEPPAFGGGLCQAVVSGSTVKMKYTPTVLDVQKFNLNAQLWTLGRNFLSDGNPIDFTFNVIDNYGTFSITPDKSSYELLYDNGAYQEILVTLASGKEPAGVYEWDRTNRIGTSLYYSSTGSAGRLVAVTPDGGELPIAMNAMVILDYAVGKTLRLRHYPASGASSGAMERVSLQVTRKDGVKASANYTLTVGDYGSFAVTSDKSTYVIPYEEARIYQDVVLTLTSSKEVMGLYDWNATKRIGTSICFNNTDAGRLVAIDGSGREIAIAPNTMVPLEYAVGKTVRLRHYPANANNGTLARVVLSITRKDGVAATVSYTFDAEDRGYEIVEDWDGWGKISAVSGPPRVGEKCFIPFTIVNRSKYYRGAYRMQSYAYTPAGKVTLTHPEESVIRNVALNVSRLVGIVHVANSDGSASLSSLTIVDDNGRTQTYTGGGGQYAIFP